MMTYVITFQPEVPLSMITVDNFKKIGKELTELWTDKPSDKKEYTITLPLTPKVSSFFEKKEEIWLSPMTKAPTPTEMSKG